MRPLILVIDDMKDERKLVRLLLRQYDCELVEAGGAREGLEAARKRRPALVFLDHSMPHMTGYDAIVEFRMDPVLRAVPIVLLTSRKFDPGFRDHMRMQGVTFLAKPVQAGALLTAVTGLIGPLAKAPAAPAAAAPARH